MHTKNLFELSFDPLKNERNIAERGLSFELVHGFAFETALYWLDARKLYPERRISALGLLGDRIFALVFVETGLGIRIINFRKANPREVKRYEQETKS